MSHTVFVVEDDDPVRDSLTQLLRRAGFAVRAFANAEAFLQQCPAGQRGCVVLDVRMPGLSGPKLQEVLAARGDDLPIIFLTGHGDVATSVQTLKAGAYDFLEKPPVAAVLIDRVRSALELEAKRYAAKKASLEACAHLEELTAREREVLMAVASGQSSKEIARHLGISFRTVEVHRAHIMQKTGARTILQLAHMVEEAKRAGVAFK